MSTNELDLDAIEARMADQRYSEEFRGMMAVRDVPALVAEVRRLRAIEDAYKEDRSYWREGWEHDQSEIAALRLAVEGYKRRLSEP